MRIDCIANTIKKAPVHHAGTPTKIITYQSFHRYLTNGLMQHSMIILFYYSKSIGKYLINIKPLKIHF